MLCGATATAGAEEPLQEEIEASVRSLGAADYQARQRAFERLLEWGARSPAAVIEALETEPEDAETAARCRELRARIPWEAGRREALRLSEEDSALAEASEALFASLASTEGDSLSGARFALGRFGQAGKKGAAIRKAAALAVVQNLLDDPESTRRVEAIRLLQLMGDPSAAPRLVPYLADRDAQARAAASAALAGMRDPGVTPRLAELLAASDLDTRRAAIRALGGFADAKSVDLVAGFLDAKEPELREAAAKALGNLPGDRRTDPALRDAIACRLDDTVPEVRFAAAETLGRLLGIEEGWRGEAGVQEARALMKGSDAWDIFGLTLKEGE